MTIDKHLTVIDRLRLREFPAVPDRSAMVESGPGYHIAGLRVSEEFWDADAAEVAEAEEDFTAELTALVQALSLRWGAPETVDLGAHLERTARGLPVRPPLDTLCGYVPRMHGWRVQGRWIGVGVGQGARELPFQLLVAVGEGTVVQGSPPDSP
ncbi:hypothetical protein NCG97_03355 [Streptomyces lydicamycinicus]|uniref:Uncharacterized protein n=1 Tax=Streptomyces lydicamycinicus TaxID=1546107 RepID=A0A0P4RAR5_9ACTN|nr:hypothetical protein [Streptomyces lydicamycinicus]URZ99931.1 hypothetical protein NCG97_03355 [Streptomyces lydicamycinicus]GAO10615.1 hypothetical protein TPA0598_07_03390 [Streptomyces lydicamycinicus]